MSWHFDHLAFNTNDGDGLQRIFEQVLGLAPGRRPPFPFPGRWLYQDQNALVHVIEQPQAAAHTLGHIAFRTEESAEAVLQRIRASGLVHQVAQVPEDGTWQIFVQVPGGLVLELDAPASAELSSSYVYQPTAGAPAFEQE